MPKYVCLLVVTEPMTLKEFYRLSTTGDTSGHPFVSVMLHGDYPIADGVRAIEVNTIARRVAVAAALAEFGIQAWGFDEYGWK